MRLGYYKGYHGNEFSEAISLFSEKYPTVQITVMNGSHEELFYALENNQIDLALNDQRRAFSGTYNNVILSESTTYIEISSRNPLCHLNKVNVSDLKNIPCILVTSNAGQMEEQCYYHEIVGLQGEFLFAETLQDARMKIITGQGYLPVDVIGNQKWFNNSVSCILLTRNDEPITKTYCAFWKKANSGYYIEEFAEILKSRF